MSGNIVQTLLLAGLLHFCFFCNGNYGIFGESIGLDDNISILQAPLQLHPLLRLCIEIIYRCDNLIIRKHSLIHCKSQTEAFVKVCIQGAGDFINRTDQAANSRQRLLRVDQPFYFQGKRLAREPGCNMNRNFILQPDLGFSVCLNRRFDGMFLRLLVRPA
ncbi:hypothetical protein D3C76_1245990 [compost metagenome]